MITEIFVEGNKIDINNDVDALLTYNIDDVSDFSSRNCNFSKTLVIPGTARNNKVFNNVFELGQTGLYNDASPNVYTNYNIAKSVRCVIFQSNIQIFKGVLRIMEIIVDNDAIEYECSVYGELGGLISAIGAGKLEDLDFSNYDHEYSIANIVDSWTHGVHSITYSVDFYAPNIINIAFINQTSFYVGQTITISGTSSNNGSFLILAIEYGILSGTPFTKITVNNPIVDEIGLITTTFTYNNTGSEYYYPLIDYGNYSNDKVNWDYRTFRPALYAKEYLNKIFNYAKYDYYAPFFDNSIFTSLIIPYNQKVLNSYKTQSLIYTYQFQNNTYCPYSTDPNYYYNSRWNTIYSYLGLFTTTDDQVYKWTGPTSNFRLTSSSSLNIVHADINSTVIFQIFIKKNGTEVYQSNMIQTNAGVGDPIQFGTLYMDYTFDLDTNDEIEFWIRSKGHKYSVAHGYQDTLANIYTTNCNTQINTTTPLLQPILLGDNIRMNDCIPRNILQKDFLASIVKMFNLYIYEDPIESRLVKIAPFIDFYDLNPEHVIDWSYKLDYSKPLSIKPLSEVNARYYLYEYKSDTDFYNDQYKKRFNKTYGSFKFDTEYEFAHEDKKIDLIFSGTPLVAYDVNGKVYPTIFKRNGNPGSYVEEQIDSNIRILQANKLSCDTWNIVNGGTTYSQNHYGYAGSFDNPYNISSDINFGVQDEYYYQLPSASTLTTNLFTSLWLPYMYEIIDQDSRMLTATFRLNEQDINMLDFSKLIMINGVLYRLNKISDYNANARDTCKVELLKVIQLNYA